MGIRIGDYMETITKYEEDKIKTIIHLENECRKVLNVESRRIKAILKPFENQKVLKVAGGRFESNRELLKKIKDLISFNRDEIKKTITPFKADTYSNLSIYLNVDDYSVYLYCCISINGGSYEDKTNYSESYELTRYIYDIKDSVLIANEHYTLNMPMFNVDEQLKQFLVIKQLKADLEIEEDKLFYGIKKV